VGAPQIDGVSRVDANDLDGAAAEAVKRNLSFNHPRAAAIVQPSQGDVRAIAIQARGVPCLRGSSVPSPAPFPESALLKNCFQGLCIMQPGFSCLAACLLSAMMFLGALPP
jgi:hypothetical protein